MTDRREYRFPKWAVALLASVLFLPLTPDWWVPDVGLRLAAGWLGLNGVPTSEFPFWGWLVRLAGRDLASLSAVSLGSALVCEVLIATFVGELFALAVGTGLSRDATTDYPWARAAAVFLVCASFAVTPGFFSAATHPSPLMTFLMPPLAALCLVWHRMAVQVRTPGMFWLTNLRQSGWTALAVLVLAGYSAGEAYVSRWTLRTLAFKALFQFLVVGVLPALVIAWFIRSRRLLGPVRQLLAFGAWAVAVAGLAVICFGTMTHRRGRSAGLIVEQVIAAAEDRAAVMGVGALDDMFAFMLPDDKFLIRISRARDPEYAKELEKWVRHRFGEREDLTFAAEFGPVALVDEWSQNDRKDFERNVLTQPYFFPVRKSWESACAELGKMRNDEPYRSFFSKLLANCGNHLGCRYLEQGEPMDAWQVFWTTAMLVDQDNCSALLNLLGMVKRGCAAPPSEQQEVLRLCRELERRYKDPACLARAVRVSGRVFVGPDAQARYAAVRDQLKDRRLESPEMKELFEKISVAAKDPSRVSAARDAIRQAVRNGQVSLEAVGGLLVSFDAVMDDRANAEKDALEVLRLKRNDPTANALIGALTAVRGDFAAAERYLRRALTTGRASAAAKNDLAYTLLAQGKLDEAEPLAREAVRAFPDFWTIRETLAAILIRRGAIDEGERELERVETLLALAKIPKSRVPSVAIDRAYILKARGDELHFKAALHALKIRTDLTPHQREQVERMGW